MKRFKLVRPINIETADDIDKIQFHKSAYNSPKTAQISYLVTAHSQAGRCLTDMNGGIVVNFVRALFNRQSFKNSMYLNIKMFDILSDDNSYFYANEFNFFYNHRTKKLSVRVYDDVSDTYYQGKTRFVMKIAV